jgi:hypothetical protein
MTGRARGLAGGGHARGLVGWLTRATRLVKGPWFLDIELRDEPFHAKELG